MLRRLFIAAWISAGLLTAAHSQSPSPAPSATSTPNVESDPRGWINLQLDEAKKQEAALSQPTLVEDLKKNGLPETMAGEFQAAAQEIVRNYQAASDGLTSLTNNRQILDDLKKQTENLPSPKTDQEVDSLRDKVDSLRQQLQTAEAQIRIDDASLTRSRSTWEEAQQQYRRAVDDFDSAAPEAKGAAALQMQLADLRQQAASAAVFFAAQRISIDEVDQETKTLTLARLNKSLKDSNLDIIFSVSRATNAITRITQSRDALRPQIEETRKTVNTLNDTVAKLNQDLANARAASRTNEIAALSARLTVANESANIAKAYLDSQTGLLSGLDRADDLWHQIQTATQTPTIGNLQEVRTKVEQIIAQLDPLRDQLARNLQDAQRRQEEAQAQPASKDAALRKLEETRLDLLQKRVTQLRDLSAQLANRYRSYEQIQTETREKIAGQAISERALLAGDNFTKWVQKLWSYPVYVTKDDTMIDGALVSRTRNVTLGKFIMAVIWLLLSFAIAKTISRTASNRLSRRFSIDPTRTEGIEKAFFFPLAVLLVLTTLNWLSIPLTAFAFMGGALAIGVGFGAQTLVNNFISGLILLAERRIKVGDTIEVDTHTGSVVNLGTRCSRILKGNGVEVLIPNSYLLEKNVVNWTLSNTRHSFDFAVSLAYGTSIEKALAVLRQAVTEEAKVLKEPAPVVSFEEFGASALIFRVYYWLDLRGNDNRVIGTNIRMRIDRLCRSNEIQIASPGQDMRLRTTDPLTIRIEDPRDRE